MNKKKKKAQGKRTKRKHQMMKQLKLRAKTQI
jgi:hypothetical protein